MKFNSQPLVSVATPVHNGEKYLEECIESILAQTYQNWEYLIVNNCSTDRSLEIAKRYAEKDSRIQIHNNDTLLKPLQNFNYMLRQISPESKYCKEVHADDWIFPDCLTQMVRVAEENPSVGIVGSYRLVGTQVKSTGLPYSKSVLTGREASRMNLLDGPYTFGTPSALLIRSDLVRKRDKFYNESHPSADTEVCHELLQKCDFGFVHQVLTFSRVHDEAISTSNKSLNTDISNLLYIFKKYGPLSLSKEEYEITLNKKFNEYYRFLGSNIKNIGNKAFWDYHKRALNKLGYSLSWFKVFKGWCFIATRRLLDTKQNIKDIYYFLK